MSENKDSLWEVNKITKNEFLNEGVKKIVIYDENSKEELAVVTKEMVTTASADIVVKVAFEKTYSDTTDVKEPQSVNSLADIYKVLYKQVELLAEHSKSCELDELIKIIDCLTNTLHKSYI